MGRKERERQARRRAYLAAKGNYWVPSDMSLEAYLQAVSKHPPIAGMLDYIETNLRDSKAVGKMFQFAESRDGSCEKCYVRQIRRDPRSELKAAPQCLNGTADVQFSRYVAEQFAKGKDPIILPPNLHQQFVYSS